METLELTANKRTATGKQNRQLRAAGLVPAVVYGKDIKSEPLEIDAKQLERVYRQAGVNKIVALKVGDSRKRNVLFHDTQVGISKGELTHVDLYVVNMKEALRAEIPIHFTGESTAVYQSEGTLVKLLETIEVECLPADLPEGIEVDISPLDDFEKTITLADVTLPRDVKLVEEDLTKLVAKVDAPRSDEELAELDEAVEETLPAGAEEGQIAVSEDNDGQKDR